MPRRATAIQTAAPIAMPAAVPAPIMAYRPPKRGGGNRASAALAQLKVRAAAAAARARRVAYEERHTLVPVVGAAALGLLKRFAPSVWDKLSIGPLTPPALIGLSGFVAQRMGIRNEWMRGITTAGLSVGAFELASTFGAGGAGQAESLPPINFDSPSAGSVIDDQVPEDIIAGEIAEE